MDILVVNAQSVWVNRIRSRLEATGARVSVAANSAQAARIMEEAEEWPDAIIVEHRRRGGTRSGLNELLSELAAARPEAHARLAPLLAEVLVSDESRSPKWKPSMDDADDGEVFVICNHVGNAITVNLQGPLIFNARTRQARQVVLCDRHLTTRHELCKLGPEARVTAAAV
ncbi:MAG TPA: flagellar assembly protein FliW [Anaerolineae bacterium]|nr:flagellar assembly protein FliW [Anaerolineae bacterium]